MAKNPRRTITVNIPTASPLLIAAEQRAAAERRPVSVTLREIAEEALAHEAALRAEIAEVRTEHAKTSELLDCSGSQIDKLCLALDKARAEIAQFKQSCANSLAASHALSAELDSANKEVERLREELRTEHFTRKCSQEALAKAKAELEAMHAARRAEAEAEDHAAERARLDEADVDRAIIVAGLMCLRHRAAAILDRKRAEEDTGV